MCRGGTGGETLTGRREEFFMAESLLFPYSDTFVMTMARVFPVKNSTRMFRGYFNRKRVRRKYLKC